jgi:flagellin-like hook-associated protein FlgL
MRINSANVGVSATIVEDPITPGTYRFDLTPRGIKDGFTPDNFFDATIKASTPSIFNPVTATTYDPINDPLSDLGVTDGTIAINGETMQVFSNWSMVELVEKINSDSNGVKAQYNPYDMQLELYNETKDDGTTFISGGMGQSNLFQALGINDATNQPLNTLSSSFLSDIGMGNRVESAVSTTSELIKRPLKYARISSINPTLDYDKGAGITSGFLVINGHEIKVDSDNDQLQDVADRINKKEIGVYAFINNNNELILDAQEDLKIFDAKHWESEEFPTYNPSSDPLSSLGINTGTVSVNGHSVQVYGSDNMDQLIDRINNTSDIGVKAWFDGTDMTMKMRNETAEDDLVLSTYSAQPGESNAFFQLGFGAMGSDSNAIPGLDPALDALNTFGVNSGTIAINGVNIAVDAAQNLNTVISDINASGAGVTASWNVTEMQLELRNNDATQSLTPSIFTGAPGESNLFSQFGVSGSKNLTHKTETNLFRQLGMTEQLATDVNGNTRIERSASSAKSLFDIMIGLRDNLLTGNIAGIGEDEADSFGAGVLQPSSLRLLDDAIAHNVNLRTKIGAKMNRVDASQERHRDVKFYTNKILSANEDIDIEEAIINYNVLQNNYRAALQVGAQVIKPTLMDYLG